MLSLEITFPSGRYYAAVEEEPNLPEWPPHPSRLFSALIAAAADQGEIAAADRSSLEWLERQPAPRIQAPDADLRAMPTSYVPPGDFNSQKKRNEHPCFRIRKDRYFPCAFIQADPVVRYFWDADPEHSIAERLDALCRRLTHVGTSHSMALARLSAGADPNSANWLPDPSGDKFLRAPLQGRLSELETVYSGTLNIRRPPPACEPLTPYRNQSQKPSVVNPMFESLTIYRLTNVTHDPTSASLLARAVRTAVMSQLPDPIPQEVHGHTDGVHVAWLPLADVRDPQAPNAPFARGRILGVAIAVPRGMPAEDRERLLVALGRLEQSGVRLPDGRDAFWRIPPPGHPLPITLQEPTWSLASRTWATVTPVVPNRLPKRSVSPRVEQSIADSLVQAGFPEPDHISASRQSYFYGAPPAAAYDLRLPRFHAVVRFPEPVHGPVIAGRLRNFGVGLFRPVKEGH